MAIKTRSTTNDLVVREIRAWMARRGVSQTDLGAMLDRSQDWVSKRLKGGPAVGLKLDEAAEIADVLEVPLVTLIQGQKLPATVGQEPAGKRQPESVSRLPVGKRLTGYDMSQPHPISLSARRAA